MRNLRLYTKHIEKLFSIPPDQSPLLFHGIICLLWRIGDFVPGNAAYYYRWMIGRARFGNLRGFPRIRSHNTFKDGRNVTIGKHFSSGKYNFFAGGPIEIGDDVRMASYIIIETSGHYFDDPSTPIYKQGTYRKKVVIEDDVWIGDRVTILGGVSIGQGSIIGAGAVVTRNIPPYSIAVGNPARVIAQRGKSNEKS